MKQPIVIPSLGESVSEAQISRIIKPSGSIVKVDEEIVELETEKVNQVLFASVAGRLELTVQPGQTVKVQETIGTIDTGISAPVEPAVPSPAPTSVLNITLNCLPSSVGSENPATCPEVSQIFGFKIIAEFIPYISLRESTNFFHQEFFMLFCRAKP